MFDGTFIPSQCSVDSKMGLHAACFYERGDGEEVRVSGIAAPAQHQSLSRLADHLQGTIPYKAVKLLSPLRKRI